MIQFTDKYFIIDLFIEYKDLLEIMTSFSSQIYPIAHPYQTAFILQLKLLESTFSKCLSL